MIYQLIYHSRFMPAANGPSGAIRDILQVSQHNNFRVNITGFLIFDKAHFIQVLEGDQSAVLETFDRISLDGRHTDPHLIAERIVDARAFPDWAMGGYVRSAESQDIYARHGWAGTIDPMRLDADQVIALALDLLSFEQARLAQRALGAA
ncbi:MAG: BLUF domain-containing protein [Asticcacaulis sp.]